MTWISFSADTVMKFAWIDGYRITCFRLHKATAAPAILSPIDDIAKAELIM
nr:hypothetical protein [Heliomarina baculiformis]